MKITFSRMILQNRLGAACALILLITGCATLPNVKLGNEFDEQGQYVKAAKAYAKAIHETESEGERNEIAQKLESVKKSIADESVASAKQMRKNIRSITVPELERVIATLQSVLKWDDRRKKIAREIKVYEDEKKKLQAQAVAFRDQAIASVRQYKFDTAFRYLDHALQIDPLNKILLAAETAIKKQKADYDRIIRHLEKDNLVAAAAEFDKLAHLTGWQASIFESPLSVKAISLADKAVAPLVQQKKWFQALEYLNQWKSSKLNKSAADVRQRGAEDYLERTRSAINQEKDFHKAYIYSLCAEELVPDSPGIFDLHQQARDEVNKSLRKYVAISTFDAPVTDADAGKQFSDALSGYLYQVLPYGINIVEREKIDSLSREQIGKIEDLLGVDLMVSGRVSLFKIDTSKDERTATVKMKVSEHPVENPEFVQMVRLYGKDTATWPKIPPQTIMEGDVQLIKYKKGTGIKKGFAKVTVRIFDTHKGTIMFVKDYDASVVEKSDFQDEVVDAGIEYIPMDLPTDTEMKEAIRKKIVSEIANVVQAAFGKREVRFLNQAQLHVQRRETADALRSLAEGHLYCIEGRISDDDKTSVEIRKLIDALVKE